MAKQTDTQKLAKIRLTIAKLDRQTKNIELGIPNTIREAKEIGYRAPRIKPPLEDRPPCLTPGCNNKRVWIDWHRLTGQPKWRKICQPCHEKHTAGIHGLKSISEVCAKNAGFDSVTAWLNSTHPYRQFRKDYCENRDGHVTGYPCTTTILWDGQLDVDHIKSDWSKATINDPENLQTLCKCCHALKTHQNNDGSTPGRTSQGITY